MSPTGAASRRLLAFGALFTVLGLAIGTTSPVAGAEGSEHTQAQQLVGGVVVLVGWAALAWGIHRFGRDE
jgi:hypothetical protein